MNLKNAKNAIFTSTPLKNIEKLVGASTCALGNHIWNGQIGIFTPKLINIKINNKFFSSTVNRILNNLLK